MGVLESSSADAGCTMKWWPANHKDKEQLTIIFTPTDNFRVFHEPSMHVFRIWEQTKVTGQNPHRQGENISSIKEGRRPDLNPQPLNFEADAFVIHRAPSQWLHLRIILSLVFRLHGLNASMCPDHGCIRAMNNTSSEHLLWVVLVWGHPLVFPSNITKNNKKRGC